VLQLLLGFLRFTTVNLLYVYHTQLMQVFEQLMCQFDAFLGVIKCFTVILSLWEYSAQLQFEFALLFDLLHARRNRVVSVKRLSRRDQLDT